MVFGRQLYFNYIIWCCFYLQFLGFEPVRSIRFVFLRLRPRSLPRVLRWGLGSLNWGTATSIFQHVCVMVNLKVLLGESSISWIFYSIVSRSFLFWNDHLLKHVWKFVPVCFLYPWDPAFSFTNSYNFMLMFRWEFMKGFFLPFFCLVNIFHLMDILFTFNICNHPCGKDTSQGESSHITNSRRHFCWSKST